MREYNRLTAVFCRQISKPGRYSDGHGLMLRVAPGGSKQWVQRLRVNGRRRDIGLGGFALVSLAEARAAALENRKLARAGGDPLAMRRAAAAMPTFAEAVERVIEIHAPTWRNAKSEAAWRHTLGTYAVPALGRMRVDQIQPADVMRCLLPRWNERRETMRKTRQRISAVFKWAVAQGFRADDPAGEVLGAALPKNERKVTHQKALPHGEVGAAIRKVRGSRAAETSKLAFEFLILTATRSNEIRRATWAEIDREGRTWTVDASRTKTGRALRVPLSDRALAVLDEAGQYADGSGLIFPSVTGKVLSDSALSKLCRELGIAGTPHGMRSAFRDWCGDMTDTPREIAEQALGHAVANEVEAAYRRQDALDKRRILMGRWAAYVRGA